MYEIRTQKNLLREEYKAKRAALSAEEKQKRDGAICKRVLSLAGYRYADILMVYAPLEDEIDIMPIIRDALSKGKTVAFPKCNPEDSTMVYRMIKSEDELSPGAFGICEPEETCRELSGAGNAMCIIPAIVYDKHGYRVGYGKGYYDRYLSSFRGIKVGVIYSDFVLDSVPHGKFDLSADVLVTEKGVITFA